jgi:hypothetical protein
MRWNWGVRQPRFIFSAPTGTNAERDDARSKRVMSQFNSDNNVLCNFRRYRFQYGGVAETFLQVPAVGLTKSGHKFDALQF